MSVVNFENDKFIPTPLPEICAPRRELLKLFDMGADGRLTVICAPAGYGKTVSTLLWVKDSGRKSVWIGLDEYDNAPFVFYKLFCTGIMSVQPDNGKMEEILNSPAFYSSPVEFTINLLLTFIQDERSYVLILDDLHTITNKKILKSLPYILKRMPHSFDILLLSRNSPPEEFNEFVESRNGAVISANKLAFSAEEIRNYYGALGRGITEEQAQEVFDATGGWVIGINVLSQSDNFEHMRGYGQILENYINRNIWSKWDNELREFMVVTSVANEIDDEICRILTGKKPADNILEKLVAQNLFVVKTSGSTYRYHHLFLEFLRDKLNKRTDINIQELTLKVADFYFERREYFKAIAYYVRAQNNDGINMCFFQLNIDHPDFNIEEWLDYFTVFVLDKLPEGFIKNNISLIIESTWANYMNGNTEATLRYLDIMNDYISSEQNLNLMKENDFLGFIFTVRFFDFRKGIYEYTEYFPKLMKTLSGQNHDYINIYTATITENFPFVHRSICDCLEIVVDMDNRLKAIKEVFGTFFHKEINVLYYCVRAGLYYELNKLEKAHDAVLLAQCELRKDIRFEIHFCVFMLVSQILNAMGKTKESESTRAHFAGRINKENALSLNPNFLAVDTKCKLWDANREAAESWLEQVFVTDNEQFRFYKLYQYFTTARAYIVLSEKEKALEYLEKLKKLSLNYNRPLDVAETSVLEAALKWTVGSKKEAIQAMEEILLAMQPYGAVRIIADEGAAVLPILKKISAKVNRADYQGQINGRYLNQVQICAYEVSKRHKGITANINTKPIKLSKQQKYVLTLLAQGYKNVEIVDMTGLTLNTIRAHTKIVYQKLGVNKAADAVIEAKRLGILEA